jgi:outer membrane lipoprotein-sorting protein
MASVHYPLLAVAVIGVGLSGTDAYDLLLEALDARNHTEFAAQQRIRAQQPNGMVEWRLGIEQSAKGERRVVYHMPVRYKGTVIVDDGKLLITFDPRAKVCESRPSSDPLSDALIRHRRDAMLHRNYVITRGETTKVGDRAAIVVVAKPRLSGALKRTVWVDSANKVLLRVRMESETGKTLYESELLFPDFSAKIPPETFSTNFGCGVKTKRRESPELFTSLSALRQRVGFEVLSPDHLPVGMAFLYAEAFRQGEGYTAVLRYSDGLARASVYQSPSESSIRISASGGAERALISFNRGMKLTIVGDLSESGMRQFASAFERADKARQDKAVAELAKKLSVSNDEIRALRDIGLDFSDVVFLLAVRKESERNLRELREWYQAGLSHLQIVRRSNADWSKVQRWMKLAGFGE